MLRINTKRRKGGQSCNQFDFDVAGHVRLDVKGQAQSQHQQEAGADAPGGPEVVLAHQ